MTTVQATSPCQHSYVNEFHCSAGCRPEISETTARRPPVTTKDRCQCSISSETASLHPTENLIGFARFAEMVLGSAAKIFKKFSGTNPNPRTPHARGISRSVQPFPQLRLRSWASAHRGKWGSADPLEKWMKK